jgi:hypothetical protein
VKERSTKRSNRRSNAIGLPAKAAVGHVVAAVAEMDRRAEQGFHLPGPVQARAPVDTAPALSYQSREGDVTLIVCNPEMSIRFTGSIIAPSSVLHSPLCKYCSNSTIVTSCAMTKAGLR